MNSHISDLSALDDQDIETKRLELRQVIKNLPGTFQYGENFFSWEESFDTLQILSDKFQISYHLKVDGTISDYSFCSSSGASEIDAEKTRSYYDICSYLLSREFRLAILRDYQSKKPMLDAYITDYKRIQDEQEKRRQVIKDREKDEAAARKKSCEQIGAVWYDSTMSPQIRYTVKKTTDKMIIFNGWYYNNQTGVWEEQALYNRRVKKQLLIRIKPVGTSNLADQKPEVPETVAY